MLRSVLITLGASMLIAAAVCAAFGVYFVVPHLLVGGLLLSVGIGYERWRYTHTTAARADPHWQATGERFIDPESGQLTEVYFDPRDGTRHYLRSASR